MPIASSASLPRLGCQARCVRKRVLFTCSQCSLPPSRTPVSSAFCNELLATPSAIWLTVDESLSEASCCQLATVPSETAQPHKSAAVPPCAPKGRGDNGGDRPSSPFPEARTE